MALKLMNLYLGPSWKFEWFDNSEDNHYGDCDVDNRIIRLNKDAVKIESKEHVKDTILHEIAHGLAPHDDKQHHSHRWKKIASDIGALPVSSKYSSKTHPLSWRRKSME
jgi:predicted SprT family Zn-dependent metalloprotease